MNKRLTLAVFLIVGSLMAGGAYYWGTSTIVADTSHPVINEAATTSGAIAYGDGYPTLLLFFDENLGVESASVEIRTIGGLLGWGSTEVETITMTLDQKIDKDTYKYQGTMTQQLDQNTQYKVTYTVYDQSDLGDTYITTIETVNLAGTVTVNGVEVTGPTDTIYVNTLTLEIRVEITQAGSSVSNVYGVVNGERLDFEKNPSGDYAAVYTLPEDGRYSFMVQVLDAAGTDTQLASFNIELGTQYQVPLMILVFGLIIIGGLYFYFERQDKTGKPKGARKK